MIAALLLVASLADKPYVLTWIVNWGGDRNPTTHSARFESFGEAVEMQDKAPLCSAPKEPPCVIWTHVSYIEPSTDNHINHQPSAK